MSSWLSGIANKASTLLESVDEYAANSIQTIVTTATGVDKEDEDSNSKNLPIPKKEADWSYPSPVELRDGSSQHPLQLDIPPPVHESTEALSDDKLIEFLNDPKANTPLTEIPLSTTSAPDVIKTAIAPQELPQYSEPNPDTIALENESLRKAVISCKSDLEVMQEHWNQSQREVSNLTREVTQLQQQLSESAERQIGLRDEMEIRDSQLEAHRLQIQVIRRELENKQTDTQLQSDRATSDLKVEIATLQSAQATQLQETSSLQREIERISADNDRLTESMTDKEKIAEQLEQSNEQLRSELKRTETDLTDYKYKATTVLQSKEKVITALREQMNQPMKDQSHDEHLEEIKKLENKCVSLTEELRECREESEAKIQNLTKDIDKLFQDKTNLHTQKSLFQTQAEDKENAARMLERQNEAIKSQLSSQQAELTARDVTISELEGQIARSVLHPDPSSQELQGRVRSLTDTVIQKQRSIETLGAENNTLKLQLDKLSQRLGQSDSLLADSSGKSKLRHITSLPLPQACPHRFGRNFENVVTGLDLLSLRVGVYFRQYPYARLSCVIYLFLFHFLFLYLLF
ncbi:hypothetical protein LOD99_3385 [Oopsacas minuta]|uniref:Golgin-84 n=1 Tax=Oopsacas minuta TaxID=111878 RepID=A0AAV7JX52_9METZ|nr:hypothetical protein LOD99_3385 [Oopsacas minuta]